MNLYIEFNGILHPDGIHLLSGKPVMQKPYDHIKLYEWTPSLEAMLDECDPEMEISIVLNAEWAHQIGWKRAAEYLPITICERVIGSTSAEFARFTVSNNLSLAVEEKKES